MEVGIAFCEEAQGCGETVPEGKESRAIKSLNPRRWQEAFAGKG